MSFKPASESQQQQQQQRTDGRRPDELRAVRITPGFMPYAEGSALIEMGRTRIVCTATLDERVPPFRRNTGQGWLTAEYAMLPRATQQRTQRETGRGGPSGRTHEIQRLIGRSLRAVTNLSRLGERTVTIDCDVIQADGGTRTASITGAYVALVLACRRLVKENRLQSLPVTGEVAAVSVGIVGGSPLLDLKYDEDSRASVDMNVVCTGDGRFVELQGTAEGDPFSREEMEQLLSLARTGLDTLFAAQRSALDAASA
jgi:ribonuclease PH